MSAVAAAVNNLLAGTTGANTARLYQMGKDDVLPVAEYPLAQIIEHLDSAICPLCRAVHGLIVDKGTPAYARWRMPSHINCRRIMVDIGRDEVGPDGEPTRPDFIEPPPELVDRHGHFVNDPEKYAALRVPARPGGRDFVFSKRPGQPGRLLFARALPERFLKETLARIAHPLIAGALTSLNPVMDAAILRQCAQQAANRQWWDHLDGDFNYHRNDWGHDRELSLAEYRRLPDAILQAEPWVAALRYDARKRGGEVPMVLLRAPAVRLGEKRLAEAYVLWEPSTGSLWHAGRLDLQDLMAETDFAPLKGEW